MHKCHPEWSRVLETLGCSAQWGSFSSKGEFQTFAQPNGALVAEGWAGGLLAVQIQSPPSPHLHFPCDPFVTG